MAVYFLRSKHLSRGRGARATRAAAYRAGELIRDERTGETYNHSRRDDVSYKEVVLPEDLAGREDMAWTQDRSTLWNAAEQAGLRCNSRVGRELLVILPAELTAEQRTALARGFSQELATKYGAAVDLCIHRPRPGADSRNHHAHLLMTVREVGPDGMGLRTGLEISASERQARGLPHSTAKAQYLWLRERWADSANTALQQAGLSVRIDHRSYAAQGLDREPSLSLPDWVAQAERQKGHSIPAGDVLRAQYQERIEARSQGPEALVRVLERQKQERAAQAASRPARPPRKELTREERSAKRRAYYRATYKPVSELDKTDPEKAARQRERSQRIYRRLIETGAEKVRERARQYRTANRDAINRNQREYRRLNADKLNARQRELRRLRNPQAENQIRGREPSQRPPPVPVQAVAPPSSWREWRSQQGPRPTAEESQAKWRAWQQEQGPQPTAEESRRAWRELREQRKAGQSADAAPPSPKSRDRGQDFEF